MGKNGEDTVQITSTLMRKRELDVLSQKNGGLFAAVRYRMNIQS